MLEPWEALKNLSFNTPFFSPGLDHILGVFFSSKMPNGNGTNDGDVQPLTCDVGLSLNTESSYPCKKTTFMPNSSPHHNQNRYHQRHQSSEIFGFYGGSTNPTADRVMGASGKLLFTATQWQELEKQAMIYKYIMASIPVPPQLVLSLSNQSNRVSTGFKFSNGSDPEPWRCRRTDGKKWRCSKDVAPDQKYCERHSHKARNRSRKHVESQSHHTKDNPTMLSAANQQARCNELFVKNGAITVSEPKNQFLQPMHSPSGRSKRDQIRRPDFKRNQQQHSYLHHNNLYLSTSGAGSGIDSWSRSGSGDDCSLTLLMQSSGNRPEFDHESFQMAVGMLSGDRRGCGDEFKPHHQLLNQSSWGDSTPGGPLGEALCLGITSDSNMLQNEPSLHGYNNSTTGGDHELGFLK